MTANRSDRVLASVWPVVSKMAACAALPVVPSSEWPERSNVNHFAVASAASYMSARNQLLDDDKALPLHLSGEASQQFCAVGGHELCFANTRYAIDQLENWHASEIDPITREAGSRGFGLFMNELRTQINITADLFDDPMDLVLLGLIEGPQMTSQMFDWVGDTEHKVTSLLDEAEQRELVSRSKRSVALSDSGRRYIMRLRHARSLLA
jgi:hypothetical protein